MSILEANLTDTMSYAFSLPTKAYTVPAGSASLHEIKHDGDRMMVVRDQDRVRLISRGGHDWDRRFPLIVEAALKLRPKHFVIDREVVVLDKEGVSDFDALSSRKHDNRAQLYAFDMLARDGEDLRGFPLALCKGGGDVLFRVACNMGLEGIVSKRLDRACGGGRCKYWIKVKNPAHPAYSRVRDRLLRVTAM